MKIKINPDNLIFDETFQVFHKVRAIIENELGEFIISNEGGKYIFPGGKRKKKESAVEAIQREIKEETGIELNMEDFVKVLELETLYSILHNLSTDRIPPFPYFFFVCAGFSRYPDA